MKTHRQTLIASAVICVTISVTSVAPAAIPSFSSLGSFPGSPADSIANGMSADGTIVVGYSKTPSQIYEPFRWTAATGMAPLSPIGSLPNAHANGISGDGIVIVGSGGNAAFRWTQSQGVSNLPDLPGGQVNALAIGVSFDGSVIVGAGRSAAGQEACRWINSTPFGLGDLPGGGFLSVATAVSADGSAIVGQGRSDSGEEAFLWTASGGMIPLGDLPGGPFRSAAYGVSADGSIVIGTSSTAADREAFRWTAATGMVSLGDLPGGAVESHATAITPDGRFIIGTSSVPFAQEAFIWDEVQGMKSVSRILTDLGVDVSDWNITIATGISADGLTLSGYGHRNGTFVTEAWIAHIPEPASLTMLALGVAVLLRRRNVHALIARNQAEKRGGARLTSNNEA